MSVAVTLTTQRHRESLGDAVAAARAQSLENRRPARRVRQEVRDGVTVILFSAGASTALAIAIMLIVSVVG